LWRGEGFYGNEKRGVLLSGKVGTNRGRKDLFPLKGELILIALFERDALDL